MVSWRKMRASFVPVLRKANVYFRTLVINAAGLTECFKCIRVFLMDG